MNMTSRKDKKKHALLLIYIIYVKFGNLFSLISHKITVAVTFSTRTNNTMRI